MKLLHFGDTHVGKSASLWEGRLGEQEAVFAEILRIGRDRRVDAIVHGGDVWETRRPSPAEVVAVERPLVAHKAAGGPPVICVAGNHDVAGVQPVIALDVLAEAGLIELWREPGISTLVPGVHVCVLPWTPVSRLVAAEGGRDRDDINMAAAELLLQSARWLRSTCSGAAVLVAHWSVSGSTTPSGLGVEPHVFREPVLPAGDLAALGFDAVLLAHIHRSQVLSDDPHVGYCGSPMALDFSEGDDEHGVWIHEFDGDGHTVEFVPVESTQFLTLTGSDTYDGIEGAAVRYRETLPEADARRVDVAQLRRDLIEAGAVYVKVTVDVEQADRPARGRQIGEDLSPAQQLDAWLRDAGVNGDEGARLVERASQYLQEGQS